MFNLRIGDSSKGVASPKIGVHEVFDNKFVDRSETLESYIRRGEEGTWGKQTI